MSINVASMITTPIEGQAGELCKLHLDPRPEIKNRLDVGVFLGELRPMLRVQGEKAFTFDRSEIDEVIMPDGVKVYTYTHVLKADDGELRIWEVTIPTA